MHRRVFAQFVVGVPWIDQDVGVKQIDVVDRLLGLLECRAHANSSSNANVSLSYRLNPASPAELGKRVLPFVELDMQFRQVAQDETGLGFGFRVTGREAEILHPVDQNREAEIELLPRQR